MEIRLHKKLVDGRQISLKLFKSYKKKSYNLNRWNRRCYSISWKVGRIMGFRIEIDKWEYS